MLTQIEETYRLCGGAVEAVKPGTENQREPVSRMYFKEGHAEIGYNLNVRKAYLSFIAGPRFGRGFVCPIIESEDVYQLGEEKLLWVS